MGILIQRKRFSSTLRHPTVFRRVGLLFPEGESLRELLSIPIHPLFRATNFTLGGGISSSPSSGGF